MFHSFFGENSSEFEIAWEVKSLLLKLLQNVMKQKDEAFAKVMWIQIVNLIKMVKFSVEVNSPFYPRTVKTLTNGDERINSPEFERLAENAKYETLKY